MSAMKFVCILLAAGQSVRMGRTKQLLPWGAKTIVEATIQHYLAAGLDHPYVVIGSDAERLRVLLKTAPVHLVFNPHFPEGMGASLRVGVQAVPRDWDALVIGLGDQPTLSAATIQAVLDAYRGDPRPIAVPTYQGRRGHPVVIGRRFATELQRLSGDIGCRKLVAAHPDDVCEVAVDDPGVICDIDTPEEYAEALARLPKT